MRKLLLLLVTLTLGASVLAFAPNAGAGGSPTFGHWAGSGDRNIPYVNSTTPPWTEAFDHAATVWSASGSLNLVSEPGLTTKAQRAKCKAIIGKIRVCNYAYGKAKGWAGIANTSFAGPHIVAARVRLNQSFIKPGSQYDTHLTCHEVGHAIGLEHSDDPFGCLTPFVNHGDDTPTAQNFADLAAVYLNHSEAQLRSNPDIEVTVTRKGDITTRTVKIFPPR